MDKEIYAIYQVLQSSDKMLTTKDISDELSRIFGIKVSKKVVKNYLWSFFRNVITMDPDDYSYRLASDKFLADDIVTKSSNSLPRAIQASAAGSQIEVVYHDRLSIQTLVSAIALVNFRKSAAKNQDLIKIINRAINELSDE